MNNFEKIIDKYNLSLDQYEIKKNIKILKTKDKKLVLKKKQKNINNIYNYLLNRNFNYFLPMENYNEISDEYEIYRYIEEKNITQEDKAVDLMYIMSMLHIKTTSYKEVLLDDVKKIYEDTIKNIEYLNSYYHNMQDYIESKIYFSPAEYLLIRHMSDIYTALEFSYNNIEKWYKIKSKLTKERVVQLHNNLSLDHLLEDDNKYLISWNYSKKDIPIYDFINFYKSEFRNLEMNSLFDIYQSKYTYTEDEKLLFMSIITIPYKVELKKSNYENTQNVSQLVKYVIKTGLFISKENEKYQKINERK